MYKNEMTWRIRVYGIVQGVGFRPTVSRHATNHGIYGTVCNKGPYVEIYAQGTKEQIEGFLNSLKEHPPKRVAVLKINTENITADTTEQFEHFDIIESEKTKGEIFISPDIAICDECKEEMFDPKDRRYLHPFINCTCCGPRLTILDALPYDRERTSMKEFPMCPDCAKEYTDEKTRRYDAQPVCCNQCGPQVYLIGRPERGRAAITYTRRLIREGKIVAIKGIGGFHLCCDATNEEVVCRLRTLKNRPAKPFAVMAKDESVVKRECVVTPEQEAILTGHQKPILLLDRRSDGGLASSVAPNNPKVGVMLPYAPVQLLIFQYDDGIEMPDLLVMTSGNTSGAPICREDEEAVAELSHLCDAMLSHNRKIRIRADDTVMDFYRNEPYMIRRSRGYAPLPFMTKADWKGQVLAVGGELKNTFCIGVDNRFYPSPYVGDLEDFKNRLPGSDQEKEAQVREAYAYMMLHPGCKMNAPDPDMSSALQACVRDLNQVYTQHPALYRMDNDYDGFEWIQLMKYDENVITFIRKTDKPEETLLAVCNFAGIPYKDYQTGVPFAGKYKEIFNSDDKKYGGEGKTNPRMKRAKKEECDERDYSIKLTLPALGVVIMTCTPEEEKKPVKATQAKKAAVKKTAVKKTATKITAAKKTTAIKKKLS